MDQSSTIVGPHPVTRCVAELGAALDRVAQCEPGGMTVAEKAGALVELGAVTARVEALLMRVLAGAGDVAERDAAPNVASWLAARTRTDHRANHREEALARSLDRDWTRVGAALAAGDVNRGQVEVIVRALDRLAEGGEVDPGTLGRAEAHLVEQAAFFGPAELRRLGDRVLEVVCPEACDDEERRRLLAAEQRAAAATRMSIRRRGDGSADVHARIPELHASRLETYLRTLTAPRHGAMAGNAHRDPATGRRLPADRILGEAFCAFLERTDPTGLPDQAGAPTRVVVTMDLADLIAGTGVATLGDGSRITAGEARRLACTAGILPAVLGGRSEVLDLGRSQRLFSPAQRLALGLRHPHCRTEGCTVPSAWCEAHHMRPWSRGGRTDLADGVLLCSWHHHLMHDERYRGERLAQGDVRFHRRT
ncbi:HNH endonuclease signature motif containing protein [Nocardioides donggukensis]|uniref:DUF222 domain-containing protein n=1 Tax=Nocardioides donggukensis TaxID=2774019 RepID=A0A927KAM0_9ACTN|nr:HNH endonuclease signature motif containing protein [Nocardioides donggukensis]MBD8870806.1 DUF222 domain-containing protein [Nocardioides donggukensis]